MTVAYKKKYGKDIKGLAKHPGQYWEIWTLTGDDTYLTGGYALTDIDQPILAVRQLNYVQYVWAWVPATGKVMAKKFVDVISSGTPDGTLVEEDASTDMSSEVIDFAVLVDQI